MQISRKQSNPDFPAGNPCMNCTKIDDCPERNPNIVTCSGQQKKEEEKR